MSIDRFHDPAAGRVTLELRVAPTEYTKLGTPYFVEIIEGETALGSVEVVVDVDGSPENPDLIYWQVDGLRGTEVADPGQSPIEELSAEKVMIEATGAAIETMLSDLGKNETQSQTRVDSLIEEKNSLEVELKSLEDRLADSAISLVQLGEIQRRTNDRLDEVLSDLNSEASGLQRWERWRTGTVHTGETAQFDSFVRQYLSVDVRDK